MKIRDISKTEKNNSTSISVFGYENKEKHPICVSKKMLWRKTCWLIINKKRRKERLCSYQRF